MVTCFDETKTYECAQGKCKRYRISYINNTVQQVFQSLIHKALTENKYELLYDEIKGLDGFEWTRFDCTKSQVLHISSNNIKVSDVILAVDINIIKKFNPYNKKEDQVS